MQFLYATLPLTLPHFYYDLQKRGRVFPPLLFFFFPSPPGGVSTNCSRWKASLTIRRRFSPRVSYPFICLLVGNFPPPPPSICATASPLVPRTPSETAQPPWNLWNDWSNSFFFSLAPSVMCRQRSLLSSRGTCSFLYLPPGCATGYNFLQPFKALFPPSRNVLRQILKESSWLLLSLHNFARPLPYTVRPPLSSRASTRSAAD